MRFHPLILTAAFSLAASAAAQPGTSLRPEDLRVASVAYRLALEAGPYCSSEPYPLTGLLLHHLAEYEEADWALQIEHYKLDRGPGVLAIVGDSAAARAGLRPGDVLLSANGWRFPDPRATVAQGDRRTWRRRVENTEARLEDELRDGKIRLTILREGQQQDIDLQPDHGCAIRARLARSDQENAFADGRYAIVTTKMLDFLKSDDELAFIIGHEAAHNMLGHNSRLDAQGVPTGILKSFGKNASRIRAVEEEADRFGFRLAWAAGYDTTAALRFWQRYYAKHDAPFHIFRTHPSLKARTALMHETVAELEREGRRPRPVAGAPAQ